MFFYVYVLQSTKDKSNYYGQTDNLVRRVKEHNLGLNQSTKSKRPWKLIYYEACINQSDAKRREKYLKTSQGGRLLKRRLKDYYFSLRFA
jgi:putative endonuclease